MTEQCKQCDGDGILNCQKEVPSSDTAARQSGTFIPGSQRIMTEQQRSVPTTCILLGALVCILAFVVLQRPCEGAPVPSGEVGAQS